MFNFLLQDLAAWLQHSNPSNFLVIDAWPDARVELGTCKGPGAVVRYFSTADAASAAAAEHTRTVTSKYTQCNHGKPTVRVVQAGKYQY